MAQALLVLVVAVPAVGLWLLGAALESGRLSDAVRDRYNLWHERHHGPQATGLPIEQLAADLRRLLVEHDRILSHREWCAVHHLTACELALRCHTQDAGAALGLAGTAAWQAADLGLRLRQLDRAGLSLPDHVGLL